MNPTRERKEIRFDRAALAEELLISGAVESGGQWRCPFHEDRNPSGSIYQGRDGVYRFKCHSTACVFHEPGDIFDVRARRTGQTTAEILSMSEIKYSPPAPKASPLPLDDLLNKISNVEAVYRYTNPATSRLDLVVVRHITDGRKSFKQIRPEGSGFVFGGLAKNPIYNRARLAKADLIVVCEGEKCVHALHDIGVIATTSPGGAEGACRADWTPLAGKAVTLWPDNDKAGSRYADDVESILSKLEPPCTIRKIDPSTIGVPEKGDAVDFIEAIQGGIEDKRKVVSDLLADSEPVSASAGLFNLIDEIGDGKYESIPFRWKGLSNLTRALLPGSVTLLCGGPGATKTFLLFDILIHLYESKVRFAAFELEDELCFHLNRIFAMKSGFSCYLNPGWVKENLSEVRSSAERMRPFLDGIARHIECSPPVGIGLRDLAKWVEAKARDGARVITIDPISAATIEGEQWNADREFLMRVKSAVRDAGASLIIVTHPKKGRFSGLPSMDDLAGGSSFQRFSHSILWLVNHGSDKRTLISGKDGGDFYADINKIIHILKSRNGKGSGLSLGFRFDPDRLSFEEIGVLSTKKNDDRNEVPF